MSIADELITHLERSLRAFLDYFLDYTACKGPTSRTGALILLISAGFCIYWLRLVVKRRRLFMFLGCFVISLAVTGYLLLHGTNTFLNLQMCDAQRVRNECEELLRRRKVTFPQGDEQLRVRGVDLPPSFVRMGAKLALVSNKCVLICLDYSDYTGRAWGLLYNPQQAMDLAIVLDGTWYRDFYEGFIPGG
jgi:hypothetical protein